MMLLKKSDPNRSIKETEVDICSHDKLLLILILKKWKKENFDDRLKQRKNCSLYKKEIFWHRTRKN